VIVIYLLFFFFFFFSSRRRHTRFSRDWSSDVCSSDLDHSKANDELKEVAKKESIPIPDSLDAKHRARVDSLSKLSGSAFDRAYIKDQLKDHQQDVKEFQNEASSGSMPAVKDFASKTLPTLQEHLSTVKDLDKGKKSTSADRSKQ